MTTIESLYLYPLKSARGIAEQGKFDSFGDVIPNAELNAFFHDDFPKRSKP